jgi:2-methylfumaryl-CoA isomerase
VTATNLLHGLRVVEFSAFVAAPSAGLALAQLGAEVIRIDPRGGNIDIDRLPLNAEGRSLYWASLNRGKRSVELDVRSPAGRALLQRLICAPGDGPPVFLTNLAVDGELSYAALSKLRPELIMVQLSGSPDGSSAVDYTVNCAAGFPGITGSGRDGPVNHVLPAWDLLAGQMLALAVLAAERHWRLTGQGQHVKLALSDVAMASAANLGYLADVELNGAQRRADGNFLYGAYGDSFACADGRHAMVVAITDRQWAALLRATGLQDALPAAAAALGFRLDDEAGRYAARGLISTALRPWFAARTLAEVAGAFTDRALLWGPYRSFAQMLAEDPRCSEANPMFRRTAHPGVGEFLTATSPLHFGGVAPPSVGLAPALGQDTRKVLQQRLGLDEAALRELRAAGTIAED